MNIPILQEIFPEKTMKINFEKKPYTNPSLLRWKNQWLLLHRDKMGKSNLLLSFLDDNFLVRHTQTLPISPFHEKYKWGAEDPRIFLHENEIKFTYYGTDGDYIHTIIGDISNDLLSVNNQVLIKYSIGKEKNWTFFSLPNELYAINRYSPEYKIMKINNDIATDVFNTKRPAFIWPYGEPHGGTPAVKVNNSFYSVFQSNVIIDKPRYYCAAFVKFSAIAPFNMEGVTGVVLTPDEYRDWGFSVVYPAGLQILNNKWYVSYGHMDDECRVSIFDFDEIENRFTHLPIKTSTDYQKIRLLGEKPTKNLIIHNNTIEIISSSPVSGDNVVSIQDQSNPETLIGKRIFNKSMNQIKLAIICNWKSACGISTYSEYLVNALKTKVGEIKIFSEISPNIENDNECIRCWKRGESMKKCTDLIKEWGADFVIVQHEFGIFPKATHFLKLLYDLNEISYAITLHSVYEGHKDKNICTSAIKNTIVHSKQAMECLVGSGHKNINVIPHGCVVYDDVKELWNIFQTPYAIVQFGFGFFYKGVDRAIDAVAHLKKTDPKFKDIFYCYLCSQTEHAINSNAHYSDFLTEKIKKLNVEENVAVVHKFHPEEIINNYLRTAKLAIFPYLTNSDYVVYGASGAIRIAMANKIPVIASENHLFDDLEGVLPRPKNHLELANEIDKIFSNEKYRNDLLEKSQNYIHSNNWDIIANKYLDVIKNIINNEHFIMPTTIL